MILMKKCINIYETTIINRKYMDRCMIMLLGYNPWNIFNVQITHWFLEQTWFSFWCQRRDPKTGKIVVRSACTYGGLCRAVFGLVWFISISLPWNRIFILQYCSMLLSHNSSLGQTFSLFLCDAFSCIHLSMHTVNKQSERPDEKNFIYTLYTRNKTISQKQLCSTIHGSSESKVYK